MAERLGPQLQSGGLEQSIHTGLLSTGLFGGASLDLNFAATKNLGPLVTFTRASSATYVGSDGLIKTAAVNEPRFDHNPTTGESLGLLVEEQRTNLLLRSEEFDNASWTVIAGAKTITANTTVAPNEAQTGDTMTADGTSGVAHFVDQSVTLSAVPYTLSVYAKAGTNNFIQLRASLALGNRHANFDVSTGTTGTSGNITSSSIEAVGNGWYRCSMVFTPTAASGTLAILLVTSNSAGSGQTNSLNTSVILWGAQLEAGAFPTSYIPTTTATVTRSADVASITGTNFSSWYRQDEGTVFAEFKDSLSTNAETVFAISDGGYTNRFSVFTNSLTTMNNRVVAAGSSFNPGSLSLSLTAFNKVALTAKAEVNGSISAANGTLSTASTPVAMPSVNRMYLGVGENGSSDSLNGTIKRLTYWPQRLPNSTLQAITQ